MYNQLYQLYLSCFEEYPTCEKVFCEQLNPERAVIISQVDGDRLIGYALTHANSIALLCVDPAYRNQGIGSQLLALAEESIMQRGARTILLGRGKHYLLQGVPMNNNNAPSFFCHRGYSADWVSVNMELRTDCFDLPSLNLPPIPSNVRFRLAEDFDRNALLKAVKDVNSDWIPYFEECNDPILLAAQNDDIIGFEIVAKDCGRFGNPDRTVGSLGCVGVVHSARNRGVGRQMVARGVDLLKSKGCNEIELLYVALVDWYERIGFQIKQTQWMGEKTLDPK